MGDALRELPATYHLLPGIVGEAVGQASDVGIRLGGARPAHERLRPIRRRRAVHALKLDSTLEAAEAEGGHR